MDLKLRRRALYTAMRPYFDDAELLAALQLWQDSYSDKPKFAFTEFLSVCCKTKELRSQRTSILSAIFKAMDLPEAQLLPDPLGVHVDADTGKMSMQAKETETAQKAPIANQSTKIFVHFFELLLSQLGDSEALGVRVFVIKHSEQLAMSMIQKNMLSDWLEKKIPTLSIEYELAILRCLVNFAYIVLCEYKGPVKADQLLAKTIKNAEPLANQLQVNVHDFL
jgi:hypothetical protein